MKVYVGIDSHTTNYTLATITKDAEKAFNINTYSPAYTNVIKYCKALVKQYGDDTEILVGYEAGCLGFKLKRDLEENGLHCIVIAPTSMPDRNKKNKKKTDKRDAAAISKCLAYDDYGEVYTPDDEDEAVRDYIRMREDHKKQLKVIKQQIGAFCTRHGKRFENGKCWTGKHMKWLKDLAMSEALRLVLDGYLQTFETITDRLDSMDKHIAEVSETDKYRENVHKLICFKGIKTLTALALIVEVCDFHRFAKAKNFAAFLGLTVGELSSSDDINHLGITKQGNRFLRRLLTEAAQSFGRAVSGKSEVLKKRQEGNTEAVIAYADKGNERLRKRFYTLVMRNRKAYNKAAAAVARELASFIWGMMTDNIHTVLA